MLISVEFKNTVFAIPYSLFAGEHTLDYLYLCPNIIKKKYEAPL